MTDFGIVSCFVSLVFPNNVFWMIIFLDAERSKCFPTASAYMREAKEEDAALLAPREPVGKQEEGVFAPSFRTFAVSIHLGQLTKGYVAPLCFPSLSQGKIAIVVFFLVVGPFGSARERRAHGSVG
jgi:hypothetical protein